jgi:glycine/sarcosine N-methyltransferase
MYTNLAGYFDAVSPVGDAQLRFLKAALVSADNRRILDAACGSGGYALNLCQAGYDMLGIDLDPGMIAYAKEKAYKSGISMTFRIEDIRCVAETDETFAVVLCLGNALPHLLSDEDICLALSELYRILVPGGILILQTENYDHILQERPAQLPTLEQPDPFVAYKRFYKFRKDGLVDFTTCLTVKDDKGVHEYGGTIPLRPLTCGEITEWLQKIGFSNLICYGGFDSCPYTTDAPYTIVVAKK